MDRKKIGPSECDKRRNVLSLELKKEIILKHEQGMRLIDIAKEYGKNPSTIGTILKHKEAIKTTKPSKGLSIISKKRTSLNDEMERLLLVWIKEKEIAGDTITQGTISEKASTIYKDIMKQAEKEEGTSQDETIPKFKASRGWFKNFRKRSEIHLSSDKLAAEKFSKTFAELVKDEGYVSQQVFNCDETGLFWKKMPRRTYITVEEKKTPGHKPMKDRLTLALCANASGDCKIKPLLVYHSENPRAFKTHKIIKERLQVMWRANAKAWVTRQFFVEWMNLAFGPTVKKFLEDNNLPLKCLLILDSAPAHAPGLEDNIQEEFSFIKVLYLPTNTTPFLQPMDQQVITIFKKLYTKHLFKLCFEVTANTNLTLREFWKQHFDIVACIKIIDFAWQEVTRHTFITAWKRLWPDGVASRNFEGLDREVLEVELESEADVKEIVSLGRAMGLEVNEDDINSLVEEHKEELSTEELKELDEMTRTVMHKEFSEEEEESFTTTSEIKGILVKFHEIVEFVKRKHPEKVFTNIAAAHFDTICLTHFRTMLKNRQKTLWKAKIDPKKAKRSNDI